MIDKDTGTIVGVVNAAKAVVAFYNANSGAVTGQLMSALVRSVEKYESTELPPFLKATRPVSIEGLEDLLCSGDAQ